MPRYSVTPCSSHFFFKNNDKLFFAGLEQSLYDVETTGLRRKQGDEHSSRNALGAWHRFVQQVSLALMTSWMSYCICASMNYGGKLWCCVGERVQQGNLVLPTRLKTGSGHRKGFLSPREGLTLGTLALQLLTWGGQFALYLNSSVWRQFRSVCVYGVLNLYFSV